MEWTDDYNRIVCELFTEQVRRGNRPNTHLNTLGYIEVSGRFYQMTGIDLSKTQIKNKWDRLKNDWSIWQKLLWNQTGTGWDNTRGVINMDNEWWEKMKVDVPGSGKFKKKALQNKDLLREMFGDISNDETDHWNPMSDNPVIPKSQKDTENIDGAGEEEEEDNVLHDWSYREEEDEEVQEVSPANGNKKRRARVVLEVPKKQKSSTALIIQEQITKIADSAESFTSKNNEHDIDTQLFVKKEQREMFLTLPTREIRLNWLTRRYNDKYRN
ncbi:hypothetical protein PAHAL_3G373900 [Panicum hallii]|uniref:Myb/SANT-like domain-containing protein n=1 Tax=Panicum hallii TaxID=206008 RepID=A0A2T8KKK0_9POAL|nr:hypothetical protein PAHAL_3G373900 [Panicum hallii]